MQILCPNREITKEPSQPRRPNHRPDEIVILLIRRHSKAQEINKYGDELVGHCCRNTGGDPQLPSGAMHSAREKRGDGRENHPENLFANDVTGPTHLSHQFVITWLVWEQPPSKDAESPMHEEASA